MTKFGLGLLVGWYVTKPKHVAQMYTLNAKLIKLVENYIARLELHRDILIHDNPELH